MRNRLHVVISVTALVIAVLGATPAGEAAKKLIIPKNSVGTVQLKKGAVATAKLRNNAVTSVKVRNGSLRAVDFAPGQLPSGQTGLQGPAGPQGEKGAKGDPGTPGVSGAQYVMSSSANTTTSPRVQDAVCPAGKKVVGGGYTMDGTGEKIAKVTYSAPWNDLTYWRVIAKMNDGVFPQNWQLVAYAVCVNAAP